MNDLVHESVSVGFKMCGLVDAKVAMRLEGVRLSTSVDTRWQDYLWKLDVWSSPFKGGCESARCRTQLTKSGPGMTESFHTNNTSRTCLPNGLL
jgi:hypothetical protein